MHHAALGIRADVRLHTKVPLVVLLAGGGCRHQRSIYNRAGLEHQAVLDQQFIDGHRRRPGFARRACASPTDDCDAMATPSADELRRFTAQALSRISPASAGSLAGSLRGYPFKLTPGWKYASRSGSHLVGQGSGKSN